MVCYWDSFSECYISIEGRRTGLLPCASYSIYYLELDDLYIAQKVSFLSQISTILQHISRWIPRSQAVISFYFLCPLLVYPYQLSTRKYLPILQFHDLPIGNKIGPRSFQVIEKRQSIIRRLNLPQIQVLHNEFPHRILDLQETNNNVVFLSACHIQSIYKQTALTPLARSVDFKSPT